MSAERKLRVGILCNGDQWQYWQKRVFEELVKVPDVEVMVRIQPAENGNPKSFVSRLLRAKWSTLFYRAYRRSFGSKALESNDMSRLLSSIPCLYCSVLKKGHAEYFSEEDQDAVAKFGLDVIVRLGFNIIRGSILSIPKYGIWSFHHGDEQAFRGGPPGFWEIMHGEKTIGSVLQRLTDKLDGGYILKKGFYPVIDHSLKETVDGAMLDSAIWPAQLCRKLILGNAAAAEGELSQTEAPIYKYPRNIQYLLFRIKQWRNKIRFHNEELNKHEEWNIGILYHPIHEFLKEQPNQNVRWLPSPAKGSFRADPFGFMKGDELVVLYEKYDHEQARGVIARVRPKRDNILKRSKIILENDTHLSYPFILEQDGSVFVIPENFMSNQVTLYRLNDDMNSLEVVSVLLEEPLLDPTLVNHNNKWWLMGTLPPHTNVGLYLYSSENLEGPYLPHTMNPVKSDIRNSRPAGTPFYHEGQLYRPAQNSADTYGGSVVINKVLQMDENDFIEEPVRSLNPMPGSAHKDGFHTLSAVGNNITLVDGKRYVTNKDRKRANMKRKMRKFIRKK